MPNILDDFKESSPCMKANMGHFLYKINNREESLNYFIDFFNSEEAVSGILKWDSKDRIGVQDWIEPTYAEKNCYIDGHFANMLAEYHELLSKSERPDKNKLLEKLKKDQEKH